jgi:hypothetical protein
MTRVRKFEIRNDGPSGFVWIHVDQVRSVQQSPSGVATVVFAISGEQIDLEVVGDAQEIAEWWAGEML